MKTTVGSITPAILVVTGTFLVVIYGLLFALNLQLDFSHRQVSSEQALHIAEAGVNYYRWHLAHDPTDFQDGTGAEGPYLHEYVDPQGDAVGAYSLEISPPTAGVSTVTIESTGWTYLHPKVTRTVVVEYGISPLTSYVFLQNASSWYASGITVNGPIHSNNGIRMDGTNTSLVTSAKEEYKCGTETGCHPPEDKPGVWGSGGDQGLWQFPVPAIDFDSVTSDFTQIKEEAQSTGLHLNNSGHGNEGYHLQFLSDGSVKVYLVERTSFVRGYSVPGHGLGAEGVGGCRKLYQIIEDESLIGTYDLVDTQIIFIEDTVWVEGTVQGNVTVAAAQFPVYSKETNIWIKDNLIYTTYDGSDSLGLISQDSIFFARDLPEDFRIDAALMAQGGKIIRHGYLSWCGNSPEAIKDKLTIYGSLVSYYNSYWNFGAGPESGFIEREIIFDPNLIVNPPPYFSTSGEYEFISWEEQ
ncbi:hypothetical protein ACFL2C_01160 [Patescibacteria group bacterium]